MTNDELLSALNGQLAQCGGHDSDELAEDRRRALDAYYQRPDGTEVPGRSTFVAGDISAFVEANLASMLEAFSGARIVEFDPLDAADENQCQLETDAVVDFVMRRNNGAWHLAQAIKDALLLRNGWMKVWCHEEKETRVEEYSGVTPEAMAELLAQPGTESKPVAFDPDDGYLKARRTYTTKSFRAESVAPENLFYPKAYDGADFAALQRIPFMAERHLDTRTDLYAMGFSREKVRAIPKYSSLGNDTSVARNPHKAAELSPGLDEDSEVVEWFEAYALVGGTRERVCFSLQDVLRREPAAIVPYAVGQSFLAPHRLTGISVADKLRHSQGVNTALTRALLDNVAATSKSRLAYLDGRVNPDDLADGRPNGAIRVKASVPRVTDAVMPLVVPDTSVGIQAAINHQRQIRTELGGAALDMASGEMQLNKQVGSMGLDRAYSVAEQLSAHLTSNVANTLVRSTFLLAHATLREHYEGPVEIKRNGRWETAVPAEWRPRDSLTVKVGMSPGERARKAASLDKLLQTHITLAQLGQTGVLVDMPGFFNLLMDWARVSDIENPERYFIDPLSQQSQQARQQKEEQAQAQQAQQAQLIKQAVELEKLRTAFDKYKADADNAVKTWQTKADLKFKYWAEELKAEIEEAKIAGQAASTLIAARKRPEEADEPDTGRPESEGEPASDAGAE